MTLAPLHNAPHELIIFLVLIIKLLYKQGDF